MIFVVTGTHRQGFNRLIKAVDQLAREGAIEDVFIQAGSSSYKPLYCKWVKSIDCVKFEELMEKADIIISHGGAGCIAEALEHKKPAILVPRLKRYREHIDDRQLELISVLEKSGRALAVYDLKDLPDAIKRAKYFKPAPQAGECRAVDIIRDFLVEASNKHNIINQP